MKRVATALVLIPAVVWLVLKGPYWALIVAFTVVGSMGFWEFDRMAVKCGSIGTALYGMIAGVVLLGTPQPAIVAILIAPVALAMMMSLGDLKQVPLTAGTFTVGVLYIFGSLRCALDLRALNPHWLMFALLLSWVGDTAALYAGRAFGTHKLAPRISPGKTWEGSVASVIASVAIGAVYARYFIPASPLWLALALGAAGNIAGQIGDLAESAMKRGAGVKDSGTSLPGHGGWLDRIDATLFSVPAVYALLLFLKIGV